MNPLFVLLLHVFKKCFLQIFKSNSTSKFNAGKNTFVNADMSYSRQDLINFKTKYFTTLNPGAYSSYTTLYREALPQGPTPYSFVYHFERKGSPFIYLLLKKGVTRLSYTLSNIIILQENTKHNQKWR